MNSIVNKKLYWGICATCKGIGKVLRPPSSKRMRRYKEEIKQFNNDQMQTSPKIPQPSNCMCQSCVGSGLTKKDSLTKIDNKNYPTVAIIGGGIGGTALAVACLHRGIPFTLYEKDKSFDSRAQGYGLTLQQASKAVEALGILNLDAGITSTKHIVHNSKGKIIGEWGLRKWKIPFKQDNKKRKNIHIARQTLRLSLLQELGDLDFVKWNHKIIGFRQTKDNTVDIEFDVDGKKQRENVDLVVGADGLRSSVRGLLIDEKISPLRYLGCIVILGICSLESLKSLDSPLLDSATVFQTVNGHERIYVMPYDKESVMWQLSFPIDEKSAIELSKKGPGAMKKDALLRLSWHKPIPEMIRQTPESKISGYPVYDREILDTNLLQRMENVTLLGDAAHPMSPFKGQGANQALLDALLLARNISIECKDGTRWKEKGLRKILLNKFEKEIVQRTVSKVKDSARAVTLLHSKDVLHMGDKPRGRGFGNNEY